MEDRNTIEMLSITTLGHLRAAVVYVMDVSEQCGESIKSQVKLFNNIKPLFANKPLFIMANKNDIVTRDELSEENQAIFNQLEKEDVPIFWTSTVTGDGIMELRQEVCDKLLLDIVDAKLRGKKVSSITNRLRVAKPVKGDEESRPPCIPDAALRSARL